tara:strand:+ start:5037 stop:5444 length:408 start_codon:yes stop_codon:yes gene_type:complete
MEHNKMIFFRSFPNIHLNIYSYLENKDKYSYFSNIKFNDCHKYLKIKFNNKDFIHTIQTENYEKFAFYYQLLHKKQHRKFMKFMIIFARDLFIFNILNKYKLDLSRHNYYFLKQLGYRNPILYDLYMKNNVKNKS